tara:strand:+ start:2001 stop:2219 length:219 start_codon:yes stop_codon:yes gene_type:complete
MKRGFTLSKDYMCAFLYPFGIEILIEDGITIAILFYKFEFSMYIGKNFTIFGDIIEKALKARAKIKSNEIKN